jgi:hypothetical protein
MTGSMVDDAQARDAIRQLMKRFEFIASQGLAMAYVLAKRDPQEYARLLETAEVALTTVVSQQLRPTRIPAQSTRRWMTPYGSEQGRAGDD